MTVGPTNDYASEPKFPPLRLAPVSRVSTDGGVTHLPVHLPNSRWTSHSGQADRPYPRIIVKDPLGRELDTFTALQEAIYRASWARKKFGEWPKTPMEWRLPKAPAPSRPDFSRSGPSPEKSCDLDVRGGPRARDMTSRRYDVGSREINLTTNVLMNLPTLEIPVDDVAFVAESLNHLPELPSFTFLRHSILAGQSTYVQIVASLLLHQRQLRARDVRSAHWSFPGFCTGCKRAGFCYGCEKNPKPHVHEDVPAMTGGGFRFWKHDRPRDPQKWKNPSTWRIPTTEEELTSIIEKYGDLAAYERARQLAENDVTDISKSGDLDRRYQRLRNLGTYPPYITIVSTDERRDSKQEEEDEGVSTVDSGLGEESRRHRSRRTTREEEAQRRRKLGVVDFEEEGADDEHSNKEITELSEASTDRILYRVDTEFVDRLRRETQLSIKVTQKNDQPPDDQVEVDEGIQSDRSANGPQSPVEIFKPPPQGGDSGSKVQGQSERRKSPVRAKKASRLEYVDKSKEAEAEEEARILRENDE
ncbi:hypothetical protein Btru_010541 [Bulinus truncatus]|nr:hypothetical protein Btru_010541 [Bulinus truncatus]